jgi:hypothetical protein
MKLKKLFEILKQCKPSRKEYYIKPMIKFEVDDWHYEFFLLPTISFLPWPYRYNNKACCEISWLNIRICIGQWKSKDDHFDSEVRWY